MTTQTNPAVVPTTDPRTVVPFDAATHLVRRERDFGVGYGRSSGYASERRYTSEWAGPRFRVA